MNEAYCYIGDPLDKVVEECAEVIHAICKVKRFGASNFHPDHPSLSNAQTLLSEIHDLEWALNEIKKRMAVEIIGSIVKESV